MSTRDLRPEAVMLRLVPRCSLAAASTTCCLLGLEWRPHLKCAVVTAVVAAAVVAGYCRVVGRPRTAPPTLPQCSYPVQLYLSCPDTSTQSACHHNTMAMYHVMCATELNSDLVTSLAAPLQADGAQVQQLTGHQLLLAELHLLPRVTDTDNIWKREYAQYLKRPAENT